jgi:L-seryl-tRNA(Ser) seleniumtransferase
MVIKYNEKNERGLMMPEKPGNKLRDLPSMNVMLERGSMASFIRTLGRETVKSVINSILAEKRKQVLDGEDDLFSAEQIEREATVILERRERPSLDRVVNGTGVIVHTNLGRSCLSIEACNSLQKVAWSYSTLEFDLDEGTRGQRNAHVEWLLCELTGAEAALVVNNNAGAVMLCLAALARGKEVVVSRGELVEIGGSFRIPEIMEFSGARLVETGATNRTHLRDFEKVINEDTSMLLKVHPSNYRILGFTGEVSRQELASLAAEKGLYFMEDLGSGVLVDVSNFGLSGEPTVKDCIDAGVDVVTFSGDKMLGGPQIGAVVGKSEIIDQLRTFPLLRALRVDKMTLSALETTLRQYLKGEQKKIPTIAMLSKNINELRDSANKLAEKIRKAAPDFSVEVVDVEDAVGGGAFPVTPLMGAGVSIQSAEYESGAKLQELLRHSQVPVITGAKGKAAVIHTRTLLQGDDDDIVSALVKLNAEGEYSNGT